MALTYFLFPVVGLTAYGAALDPIIRLMPPLLAGEGNEDRALGGLGKFRGGFQPKSYNEL